MKISRRLNLVNVHIYYTTYYIWLQISRCLCLRPGRALSQIFFECQYISLGDYGTLKQLPNYRGNTRVCSSIQEYARVARVCTSILRMSPKYIKAIISLFASKHATSKHEFARVYTSVKIIPELARVWTNEVWRSLNFLPVIRLVPCFLFH
jgi:hypothetical protein